MKNLITLLFAFLWLGVANAQWSDNPAKIEKLMIDAGVKHTALTNDGRIYVTWGNPNLGLMLLNADGTAADGWNPIGGLSVLPANTYEASWYGDFGLTVAPDNSAILVYSDSRNANPQSVETQVFQPFAYRIGTDGTFKWDRNGITLQDSREISPTKKGMTPRVTMTNDGYVLVCWSYLDEDNCYSKITMMNLTDGEFIWENPITISNCYMPNIVPSGKSDFIVVYKQSNSLISSRKYSDSGDLIWERQIGKNPIGDGAEPIIASDGRDGVVVVYQSVGNSNYIITQRISSSGSPTMGIDGVPGTNENVTKQSSPQMSVDTQNQIVYLQWTNTLLNDYRSFHVQAIDFDGEYLFSSKGLKISEDPANENDKFDYLGSGMSSTGDGVICFYSSVRENEPIKGLKAIYISKSGELIWKKQVATIEKTTGIATPFFNGQAVVLWKSSNNLYGQNIHKDGSLGVLASGLKRTSLLENCTITHLDNNNIQIDLNVKNEVNNVKIEVSDMLGKKIGTIANGSARQGINQFYWNTTGLNKGIYLLTLVLNSEIQTTKIIL